MTEDFAALVVTASFIGAALLVTKAYVTYKPTTKLRVFLAIPIVIPLLPLLALIILILAIYRQILTVILSNQHGHKFGGLVEGFDAFFVPEEIRKIPTTAIFMVQYDQRNPQNFYDAARHILYEQHSQLSRISKLFSTLHYSMGYCYYLKDAVKLDDCVRPLQKVNCSGNEVEKDEFLTLMGDISQSPLPKNGEGLWEVLIGTQPIKWTKKAHTGGKAFYPICLRIQHCVGDGYSMIKLIARVFVNADATIKLPGPGEAPESQQGGKRPTAEDSPALLSSLTYDNLKHYVSLFYTFFLCLATFLIERTYLAKDQNILHGPSLTHKKLVYIAFEESPHCVEVIKRIKGRLPGCSFMDVFLTALSASFADYYEKKSGKVPVYITAAVPQTSVAAHMGNMADHKLDLVNNLAACMRKLPIIINQEDNESTLTTRLRLIRRNRHLSEAATVKMIAWIHKIFCGYSPVPFIQYAIDKYRFTLVFSNLPAPPSFVFREGCPLYGLYTFIPHRDRTGLCLTLVTFEDRLQLTLLADKGLICDQKDAQSIVDNVFKYLDLMDAETKSIPKIR